MTSFDVEFSATAERQLRKLPRSDQVRVLGAVAELAAEPRPRGARKLRGHSDVYRIRVGVFRVLYAVESHRLLVLVLKIGHRRDVYR